MFGFDRITFDPNILGGKACIRGMRVTVAMAVGQIGAGQSIEDLLTDYSYLDREDILQALDEQCREECQSIFGGAQGEVDEILAKVEVEAKEIRAAKLEKIQAEAANEKSGMFYSARLRAKNYVALVQKDLMK